MSKVNANISENESGASIENSYTQHQYTHENANDVYWDAFLSWLPILLFLLLYAIIARSGFKKQKQMMDVQYRAYQELQNINKSLVEIVQKLDKKS